MTKDVKKYNYYIFDWDGTLANTLEVWFQAYIELFKQYGIKASYNDIASKAYGNPKGSISFGIENYKDFNKQLFELVRKDYAKASLYPFVEETLKKIHNEMQSQICIFSSTERNLVKKGLEYQKLLRYADMIIGREDVVKLKPDPQGIDIALNKFKGVKKHAVIVGDSDKDINAGKNSHIDTILFLPQRNSKYVDITALKKLEPTYTINSLSELLN